MVNKFNGFCLKIDNVDFLLRDIQHDDLPIIHLTKTINDVVVSVLI